MKKGCFVGVVILLVAFVVASAPAEPIKLGMSTWLGYAPLYLAKEKGFFQKQGVDVEIVVIESPADRRVAFAADKIQGFATTVDTQVMTAAAENPIPVKQVLAIDDSHGGDGIVAPRPRCSRGSGARDRREPCVPTAESTGGSSRSPPW